METKTPEYVNKLVDCYNHKISEKEFIEYLVTNTELQNIFNKQLKSEKSVSFNNITEELISCYNKIGTPNEVFFDDTKTKSITGFVIHLYVEKLLGKAYFEYLSKDDQSQYVLNIITDLNCFYNADQEVEDYIKSKVLDNMPEFKKSTDAVKFAKTKLQELFICEKRMPSWAQNCEWPFDKNGVPMKFISQKKSGEKTEFVFEDKLNNRKVIVQYY